MPTFAHFRNISIDKQLSWEIDGTSPYLYCRFEDQLNLTEFRYFLEAMQTDGKAEIWVTKTNNFKEGKPGLYALLAEVPATAEHAWIDVSKLNSSFYKFVLKAKENTLNQWIIKKEENQTSN